MSPKSQTKITDILRRTYFWENLTKLTVCPQGLVSAKSLVTFNLSLLIFGGLVDGQDIGLADSLAITFGISKNKEGWNKLVLIHSILIVY